MGPCWCDLVKGDYDVRNLATEPVASLIPAVAHRDEAPGLVDHETADAVDLRPE